MRRLTVLAAIACALGTRVHTAPLAHRAAAGVDALASAAVSIRTFQFTPDTLRVSASTRVVWTNADEIEHTITSGAPDARDDRFNGVVTTRGAAYSAVFEKPGTYRYFCDRHRFMTGTVIVNP